LADYVFSSDYEHQAAFAWAERKARLLARRPSAPALAPADLLPPLPHWLDVLMGLSAFTAKRDQWMEIPVAIRDPRAAISDRAWPPTGWVHPLTGAGDYLLIRPVPLRDPEAEIAVSRLVNQVSGRVDEHRLFDAGAGVLLRFGTVAVAQHRLRAVVMADGAPPPGWEWWPSLAPLPDGWRPDPYDPLSDHIARIRRGPWRIQHTPADGFASFRLELGDGGEDEVVDCARFDTLDEAKQYCEWR
jgi:hypothetical protein